METPVVTIVGKTSTLHVERVLGTSRDENLRMIADGVSYCKARGREVIYDAEHFFDGVRLDREYAHATLRAAAEAGADCLVLCDTNGGELPHVVAERVADLRTLVQTPLGIHTHNDSGLALANALAAVLTGCSHVQGTINGYGERCGNMDLIPLIATLQLKLGYPILAPERLRELTAVAHVVAAVANLNPDPRQPYVGRSAFAHKGGIHVAAVAKVAESYQHIDPALVGNEMRVVVSELAGRRNIELRAQALRLSVRRRRREAELLQRIKEARATRGCSSRGGRLLRDARATRGPRLPPAVRDARVYGGGPGGKWSGRAGAGDGETACGRGRHPHRRGRRRTGQCVGLRCARGATPALSGARQRATRGLQGADRGRAFRNGGEAARGPRVRRGARAVEHRGVLRQHH